MRAASERDDGMQFNAASLRWLPKGRPDSPLGQKEGWVGAWSRHRLDEHGRRVETEHTRIDGSSHRGQSFSWSTWIKMPGATALCPIYGDWHYSSYEYDHFTIFDGQGMPLSRFGPQGIPPAMPGFYPRDLWLSYLTPRDVRISTLLRAVDLPLAQALLAAATADQPFSVDDEAASERLLGDPQEHWPQTFAAVSAHFGAPSGSSDTQTVLLGAITKMVGQARLLELRVRPAQPEGGPVERPWIYDDHLAGWLPLKPAWAHGERSILHSVPQILAVLSGERAPAEVDLDSLQWKLDWPLFIDALPRLLAFFLLRSHQPAQQREIYRTALEILIEDCPALFGGKLHVGVLQTEGDSGFFDETQTEEGAKFWRTLPDGRLSLIVVHKMKFWLSGRKEFHFWWIALDRGQGALTLPANVAGELLTQTLADDRDFLRATLDLYDAQGPVPYDLDTQAKTLDEAAQRALLSQSGARWLWAGLPIPEDGYRDFLGKTLTSLLQVKLGEVIEARKWLMEELPERTRVEFFADCTRVSRSADLWGAEGVAQFVRAAHNAWPRPAPVAPEAFLEGCKGSVLVRGSVEERLRMLVGLSEQGFNETELRELIHPQLKYRVLLCDLLSDFAQLMPYLANTLPVGDALLEPLPVAYAQLRAHVAPDDFVELPDIHLPDEAGRDHFFTHFEADEQQIPQEDEPPLLYKEDEQLLVTYDVERGVLWPYLRVQAVLDPAATLGIFTALYGEEAEWNLRYMRLIPALRWLLGSESAQLIERSQSTPVPAGQLEADPRLSAPETVAQVRAQYGISEEAAALYLVILAHPQPKTKTIQAILGWKPAAYRKASAELVAAELLIADKRAKTGRAHFLPGPWGTERPLEVWKLDQLERGFIRPQLLLPWFVAYPQIWARVEAGDGPKA